MTDERRYQPDEVEAIFESAVSSEPPRGRALASAEGPTLAELQAIGAQVGIPPERIAAAAAALDAPAVPLPRRTMLGMPVTAGRVADLPRAPTDREWAMLLGELRETFGAVGRDVSHGEIRGWVNGNLHAYIEPTETGHRFRLGTSKGDAVPLTTAGVAFWILALVICALLLANGNLADKAIGPVVLALIGTGALARNALGLPQWAQERESQMERIVQRALALLGPGEPTSPA